MKYFVLLFVCFTCTWRLSAQEAGIRDLSLCWDVSSSMSARDFDKEKAFLEAYFQKHPEVRVTLLPFSSQVWGKEIYEVRAGRWSMLEERLQAMACDGATDFTELTMHTGAQDILLFTDGRQNLGMETPIFGGRLTIVNSLPNYDAATLNLITLLNEADLYHLNGRGAAGLPISYTGEIFGDMADPLQMVLSIGSSPEVSVQPDRSGRFSIKGRPGDTLTVQLNGSKAGSQVLGKVPNLALWVEPSGEIRLDEVVVSGSTPDVEVETVETALGPKNRDGIGYAVQSIDSDRIPDAATDVSTAIQGKFSGVSVGQNDDISRFETRTKWSILSNNYGLIVLDGVPMGKANSSYYASASSGQDMGFLDPKNIAGITVLKGLVATNRYGSAGANGVLLITTKAGAVGRGTKTKDRALVENNVYDGKIRPGKTTPDAPYLSEIKKAGEVGEAYAAYLSLRPQYKEQPAFFIDMAAYMKEAAPALSFRILSNLLELPEADVSSLKALLFQARRYQEAELEVRAAERLASAFPGRADVYLYLALARETTGDYQGAARLLVGILDGRAQPELDFNPIRKSAQRALANLVFHHASELDLSEIPPQYRSNLRYNARIIFEWVRPDMEFQLQFVNPQKRFFSWDHGPSSDLRRVRQEFELGYATEEFEITGPGVAGEWIINLNYGGSGNGRHAEPVFLHCRVQLNFGHPNQRTEDFVVRLDEVGTEIELARLKVE